MYDHALITVDASYILSLQSRAVTDASRPRDRQPVAIRTGDYRRYVDGFEWPTSNSVPIILIGRRKKWFMIGFDLFGTHHVHRITHERLIMTYFQCVPLMTC